MQTNNKQSISLAQMENYFNMHYYIILCSDPTCISYFVSILLLRHILGGNKKACM